MRSSDCSLDIAFWSLTIGRSGSLSLRGQVGADEAPADDLVEPLGGERVARAAPQPLARGQSPGGAVARGQRRRQRVERAEPRHLLDQVGFAA